jgi:predicted dehydrogenase
MDKEKAGLEGLADAVAAGKPFLVPPEEAVNGIAVLEAIVDSAARGQRVSIA